MKRKQCLEEQIIDIPKEAEARAVVMEPCRKHGLSNAIYYAWNAKLGGLEESDVKRLRSLVEEIARFRRLLVGPMLGDGGLKDLLSKSIAPAEKRHSVAQLQTMRGMSVHAMRK